MRCTAGLTVNWMQTEPRTSANPGCTTLRMARPPRLFLVASYVIHQFHLPKADHPQVPSSSPRLHMRPGAQMDSSTTKVSSPSSPRAVVVPIWASQPVSRCVLTALVEPTTYNLQKILLSRFWRFQLPTFASYCLYSLAAEFLRSKIHTGSTGHRFLLIVALGHRMLQRSRGRRPHESQLLYSLCFFPDMMI